MFIFNFNNGLSYYHVDVLVNEKSVMSQSHVHDTFELVYFVKGDVYFTVEQKTRHLEAGDFILIAPGMYHHVIVKSNEYERYVIRFPFIKFFQDLYDYLNTKEPFFTNCQKLGPLISNLDDYAQKYEGIVLESLMRSELLKIIAMLCYNANNAPQIGSALIDDAIKYINLHLQDTIYLDEIAAHCKVSKVLLSNEFKEIVGITIMNYVAMKKAIATMKAINNGMKKGEAARKYGYNDYSTFYRGYQKLKDMKYKSLFDEIV